MSAKQSAISLDQAILQSSPGPQNLLKVKNMCDCAKFLILDSRCQIVEFPLNISLGLSICLYSVWLKIDEKKRLKV